MTDEEQTKMLSSDERASLIDVLARYMPARTFLQVVTEQKVVSDEEFKLLRRWTPDDPMEARRQIAGRIIDAYEAAHRTHQLTNRLYRETYLDDELAPLIHPFTSRGRQEAAIDAVQGAIAKRAHTMSSRKLRSFLADTEGRICIVVAENDSAPLGQRVRLGTGFLVGPNIVLTAYHTLRDHLTACQPKTPAPGRLYAIFDHYEGDPLEDPVHVPNEALEIPFAASWLIECEEEMPDDGLFRAPDPNQLALLPTRLDFALIQLARDVGMQSRGSTGGERRAWIDLPNTPLRLVQDDRIIIPQHPNGYPQRIDFGRFSQPDSDLDTSSTRLRYDTETDQGTSGAPCFDQGFRLVGMHNAAFKPQGVQVEKNQAIRIDRIRSALRNVPGNVSAAPAPAARLWSTSIDSQPRVILGRQTLLDWLVRAATDETQECAQRVYVATANATNTKGFGKSYTLEILQAARRGTGEPIVLLGPEDNRLPDNISDVMRAIGFQLGMDAKLFDEMPARPSTDLPIASPNADKLEKWASSDVPAWFDHVLGEFRERVVDAREEARDHIEYLRTRGRAPSPDELALAQQPNLVPDLRRRWPRAWIVIADLPSAQIPKEVRELIAAMVGGKVAEASMPQQLRRLRWLFVGYLPDFLAADQVTREVLDPTAIGADALVEGMTRLADSTAQPLDGGQLDVARVMAEIILSPTLDSRPLSNPNERLPFMQQQLFPMIRRKLPSIKRDGR